VRYLKQSTARNLMVFLTSTSDHIAGATGLTLTITSSKDGSAFASISPTVTERGSGWYSLALTTAHTDTVGDLALHITAIGADPTDVLSFVGAGDLDYLDAAITSRASQTSVDTVAGYVDTEVAAIKAKTDLIPASPASVSDIPTAAAIATAVLTTQMTEAYNTDGKAPTLAQAQFVTMQRLTEFGISGTAITVKKLDGTTTAYTLTMDSASAPTSVTRAS
jgi:hypothetical protein